MFKEEFKKSIRVRFLIAISSILFASTFVLSTVVAMNEKNMIEHSLRTKGQGLASYIAYFSVDPLLLKDYIQLDSIVNGASKDADVLYAIIQGTQGKILTSQFASINYQSPRLRSLLSGPAREDELEQIIASIDRQEAVTKFSAPITTGADTIGTAILCLSKHKIYQQMIMTILYVIMLSAVSAFALGYVLFAASKKILLTPIIEIAGTAARLATGDLSARVKAETTGEVKVLVDSFNQMARDLQKTTVSKKYVDDIFKSMIDTLIVASPDGTIRTVNHAACALLGYREEELTGQPIKIIFAGDGDRVLEELIEFRSMKNTEHTYVTKDNRKIPVLISSSVIYSGDATPQGIVCVAVDITGRKRAEEALKRSSEELQQSNEELKNFAYIVSHDLRAPLVNIKGFSEELGHSIQEFTSLLQKYSGQADAEEKQRTEKLVKKDIPEALGFIGSSVTRMDALINSILKLSRLGRNELKPEQLHTEKLVHHLLKTLAHQIDMHKAEVTIGPLPDIIMDKTAAEQIFGNLLDNALKYLEPSRPGEIAVTAEQSAAETTFTIRDNGRGIAKEDTQKVFELFRRVGRQDVPGEGMGLTYVKTLVRRLGGRISCESEPGVGSAFSFTIPARSQMEK